MSEYTKQMHLANLQRDIEQAKKLGLKLNVFIIGNKCCAECDKINETKMPFENVLANPILPYIKCSRNPFCICCYGFEPLRDENNILIETTY